MAANACGHKSFGDWTLHKTCFESPDKMETDVSDASNVAPASYAISRVMRSLCACKMRLFFACLADERLSDMPV
jgi:hypothetical protein